MRVIYIKSLLTKSSFLVIALIMVLSMVPLGLSKAGGGYPWDNQSMNSMSPLGFYYKNCTDFVAWKLNVAMGGSTSNIKFKHSSLKFPGGNGNAVGWKDGAIASGYTVNTNPSVGSVAWWGATTTNSSGHVAIVSTVNQDGSVNIEQYNTDFKGSYSTQNNVRASAYLHIADTPILQVWGGVGTTSQYLNTSELFAGQKLMHNQYILSENGRYLVLMQTDGNLVLYGDNKAIWSSQTTGSGASYAIMQSDGNFVLYKENGVPVWHTITGGKGQSKVVIQNDGNFVTYQLSSNTPTWHTSSGRSVNQSYIGSDRLGQGMKLQKNQYIQSLDKRYYMLLQDDGNLVLYSPGYHVLWHSSTGGKGASYAIMQSDGNFVLYTDNGVPVWHSSTGGKGASYAIMQSDGNFVLYTLSFSQATFHTQTGSKI